MMPGETPPPPAGTAACANCGLLQQNINEYVAALIALKQKMIDGDRLLTEYQQKCTELQFAEREISALRCQVEQMLQKLLPLEKCQEELGSLKAELEEKKSSLKIYRESQLEYVKIKEEIVNSDAVRKKLETKVKKLEEAATKQTHDFRQLKTEKKRLEKELKKAQGKLDGVLNQKCRKVKHAETQSSGEDIKTTLDKEKIKLLLEELWMCIDSATGKRENQENDPVLASIQGKAWPEKRRLTVTEDVQIHQKIRKCDGRTLPWYSSLESTGKQNPVAAKKHQASTEPFGGDCVENGTAEDSLHGGRDKTVDVTKQTDGAQSTSYFSDQEEKGPEGNLMDILNWARPLPALLSPVRLSPVTEQTTLFGDVTSSSDEEVDGSASALETILQEDQVEPLRFDVFSLSEESNRQNKSRERGPDAEISCNLNWNEKTASEEERDAETKQGGAAISVTSMETNKDCLEESSENTETETLEQTEATACELETIEEQKGDSVGLNSEEGGSSADFTLHSLTPQNQMGKRSEVERADDNVERERHGEFAKAERDEPPGERATPRVESGPQNTTHLPPEQRESSEEKSDVLVWNALVENESKSVIKAADMASHVVESTEQAIIGEEVTAAVQMKGLCAEADKGRELSENVVSDTSSLKSCEVECPRDLMIQRNGEGIIMEAVGNTGATDVFAQAPCFEIKRDSEEILEKQHVPAVKDEADREYKPETVDISSSSVSAVEGIRNSLSVGDTDRNAAAERTGLLALPNGGERLRVEDVNIGRPGTAELAVEFNRGCLLEKAESPELLRGAENEQLVDTKERGYFKGEPQREDNGSSLSQGKSDSESTLPPEKTTCSSDAESSVAKSESSVLDFMEIKGERQQRDNPCGTLERASSTIHSCRAFGSRETELKLNPEHFGEESCELLNRGDTIASVSVEGNRASQALLAKPLNEVLETENVKCDEIKGELNEQNKELLTETCSGSFNCEESVVKKMDVSELICQPASEMDLNSAVAFSPQENSEVVCADTEERDSSAQVGLGLGSTTPPDLNCSLQEVETNFKEKGGFSHPLETKGGNCAADGALNSSSESSGEGAEVLSERDNTHRELDCPKSEFLHKNEEKIPDEKEQPADEPQASAKSQIRDASSSNKNTSLLQTFDHQESGCSTSACEFRTDSSRTDTLTGRGESKDLTSFEVSGENTIKRCENGLDSLEQNSDSDAKEHSVQDVRYEKRSECVPVFRKELRASREASVGALETDVVGSSDDQGCELHSAVHPGDSSTVSQARAGTVVGVDTHCETNSSPVAADELSSASGEDCPTDLASWERESCSIGENNADVTRGGSNRKTNVVECLPNPTLGEVECSCETVGRPSEPHKPAFENKLMLESESCVDVALKKDNKLKCKEQEPSEILTVPTETVAKGVRARLSKRLLPGKRKTKTLKGERTEPVANAETSLPTKCSPETINKIRQEMGPPLPPLLLPLAATPPKAAHTTSPAVSSTSSSLLSPLDDLISPLREGPLPPLVSPLTDTPKGKSAHLFSPSSPSEKAVGRRIRSSPLKFCTSIPKHALPVPGRFPPFAADSAAPTAPQENSVRILDTMYPELSARARTLNILKGNIQLNRCAFPDGQGLPGPVAQIGGFKTIASTSTAFVKTGSNLKSDCSNDKDVHNQQLFSSSSNHLEKRTLLPMSMPRSAKRLRLDSESPRLEPNTWAVGRTKSTTSEMQEASRDKTCDVRGSAHRFSCEASQPVTEVMDPDCEKVSLALKKIAESCFDLLPVIKGHVHIGNVSRIPVMRDEEKEVVYEFGLKNKLLAESLLHAILSKLKAQKSATDYNLNQALCRVYTGVCRQLGDLERARLFCYSLLKEDFPESEKLILFIAAVWSDIFVFKGAVNKAVQLIVRQSASQDVLACLSAYLSWEQSSSLDAGIMVSNLLSEMQSCPKVELELSERCGEDLSEEAWQYLFAVDLLCSHLKWNWTNDNVISKVLWPSMDKWVKKRKGHEVAQSVPDSVIALTLRLIGRLGQIGLKEGHLGAVKNVSSVIGLFVQQAKEEGVPWGVQLSAIYSLFDLSSSNPEGILEAIHAWRATAINDIPLAVTSAIAEITSVCKMELN